VRKWREEGEKEAGGRSQCARVQLGESEARGKRGLRGALRRFCEEGRHRGTKGGSYSQIFGFERKVYELSCLATPLHVSVTMNPCKELAATVEQTRKRIEN